MTPGTLTTTLWLLLFIIIIKQVISFKCCNVTQPTMASFPPNSSLLLQVWFKNRRAKCRQQVKQHQQQAQHNGDKSGVSRSKVKGSAPPPAKRPSSTTSSPAPAAGPPLHRDSPSTPYIKPMLSATPPVPSVGVYPSGTCTVS